MDDIIKINNHDISIKEYKGQRVVTFKDIDAVHGRLATLVAVWIVVNEIISILENMIDIGIDLPPFLMPIVKRIKKEVEEAGTCGKTFAVSA